jgi:hypothetical protein
MATNSAKFSHLWVLRACEQLGVKLIFVRDVRREMALVGVVRDFVFVTHKGDRRLEISVGPKAMTAYLTDESRTRRTIFDFEMSCLDSFENFRTNLYRATELLAGLKGKKLVDTPFDWGDYK